ncbi:PREDICTED: putative glucuronosyltransferase PGSIP7 isoform X2 [Tarenaya hassleriana]|uniref:putative glucuronosyltransferase PGSIP7 isoform X2 n=1 Tax=Tarenaya hassleriana TaxID=28532 RepID=UPI00053C56A7|nr:PREDICTED: putative glucuronosyltransferase PGSIP7 isoform X2 [Tarenaya hassleriana]
MDIQGAAGVVLLYCWVLTCLMIVGTTANGESQTLNAAVRERGLRARRPEHRNAYATMMYMGTPRDYEFYVATRVLIRSLRSFHVDADIVVIASLDVPPRWVRSMEEEDGAKVVRVENVENPYKGQRNFNRRFKLTLNKLYAWALSDYDRVVMLDADNLFLRNADELFQCGQFCAVFINPCIFHTGLFVLRPSMDVFRDMIHELELGRHNPDGADQGFLVSYFSDLLGQPLFHPPSNRSDLLDGHFRLPLGYQMDASYYYLRLRWNVPCGPNSVITFPGAVWLKPWYWWSWPVLPLGLSWHEQRRQTLGGNATDPYPSSILRRNHRSRAPCTSHHHKVMLQTQPLRHANGIQARGNRIDPIGLHPALLHHPLHHPPANRLVTLLDRLPRSLLHSHQLALATGGICPNALARHYRVAHSDGISMVSRRSGESLVGFRVRVFLCALCLGVSG